jgi:hypothetical protein
LTPDWTCCAGKSGAFACPPGNICGDTCQVYSSYLGCCQS